ncbi:MAG: rane protein required for colicin production [Acidobacteriota bacterium]|jgi:membrane protein required for colicin V production|nr:rane protein required for colicin production [Acidobacteriota bacterium]
MTFFDFIVLALIASSVVSGAMRGIVKALLTGAALIIGLLIAAHGYEAVGSIVRGLKLVESKEAANAVGFLLIMTVALVGGFLAGRLVTGGLRHVRLEWFDRVLGGAFGLLRGLAVCSALYLALTAFPVRLSSVTEARTAPILAQGARMLGVFTSQEVRTRFYESYSDLIYSK